jgi:hypothetical protein
MNLQQAPTQLANFPINVIFLSNGQIAFQAMQQFPVTLDQNETGETLAWLSNENIIVKSEVFMYNQAYDVTLILKEWLKSLNLISPI